MTIAVTGATGQLGRLAIAALKARGLSPVALARSPAKAADLGVEARAFDYTAPDAAALKGVDVLVLISSSDFNDRPGQHRNVIAAARAAGVGRIVYTSILRADTSAMILAQDHAATEAALKALPGVESHRMSDDGRLIVTVEDAPGAAMSDTLIAIHRVPQVLAATLAYEYTDNTLAIPTNSPCQEVHP